MQTSCKASIASISQTYPSSSLHAVSTLTDQRSLEERAAASFVARHKSSMDRVAKLLGTASEKPLLSVNHLAELIQRNPDKSWDWDYVSRNPNITWEYIQSNPDMPWDWDNVSCNPNVTRGIMQSNSDKPWNCLYVSYNSNLTSDSCCYCPRVRGHVSAHTNSSCHSSACCSIIYIPLYTTNLRECSCRGSICYDCANETIYTT